MLPPKKSNFNPVYDEPKQGGAYLDHLNQLGAADVRLETESAIDTMDFVNKIVQGRKPGELPSKSTINRGNSAKNNRLPEKRLAEKLDTQYEFNFPVIPPYEGVQQNLPGVAKNEGKPNFTYLPKPDIFSKGYQAPNPHDVTSTSIGSLNSMNLDRINQRNEERIAKLGAAFDNFDISHNSSLMNDFPAMERKD